MRAAIRPERGCPSRATARHERSSRFGAHPIATYADMMLCGRSAEPRARQPPGEREARPWACEGSRPEPAARPSTVAPQADSARIAVDRWFGASQQASETPCGALRRPGRSVIGRRSAPARGMVIAATHRATTFAASQPSPRCATPRATARTTEPAPSHAAASRARARRARGREARSRAAPPQLPAVLRRPGHLAHRHLADAVRDRLWMAYRLTDSALMLGLVAFFGQAPTVADRADRRRARRSLGSPPHDRRHAGRRDAAVGGARGVRADRHDDGVAPDRRSARCRR